MLRVDPALFHYFRAGGAQAELIQTDDFPVQPDVLIPNLSDPGFDRDAFPALIRQNFFAVFFRLTIKAFEARQRNHSYAIAELSRRRDAMLQFASARHDNQVEFPFFLLRNVTATEDSVATQVYVDIV